MGLPPLRKFRNEVTVAPCRRGCQWQRTVERCRLRARSFRTFWLEIFRASAFRLSDFSIGFGRASSGESQLPGDSGEPALVSVGPFAYPTRRDSSGQRVSAFFL